MTIQSPGQSWAVRPPDRAVVQSSIRPLRLVVALESPVSGRAFRRAVRLLCGRWGGAKSLIVPLSGGNSIDTKWLDAIRALDPDLIFVQNSTADSRARILGQLKGIRATPLEVADLSASFNFGPGWYPMDLATAEPAISVFAGADRLAAASPLEVGVLGLSVIREPEVPSADYVSPKEIRATVLGPSVVRGSPVAAAAFGIAGSNARRPIWWLPFLWHERDDLRTAMSLWNLRAVVGAVGHGGIDQLSELLDRIPARASLSRFEVLSLRPLPTSAKKLLKPIIARGAKSALYSDYRWPRRPNRGFVIGYGAEIDDAAVMDGVLEIPLRPPPNLRADAGADVLGSGGAYGVELELELPRNGGKRASLPPRSELRNLMTRGVPTERLPQQLSRLAVQSRVLSDGSTALVARRMRFAKSIVLRVPTLAEALNPLGTPVRFALSDKGLYSRWVATRLRGLSGLHSLLTDPRSAVLVSEFRIRHDGKRIEGSYRRSLTADEMRAAFTEARQKKLLANRITGGATDEEWLALWLSSLVADGVLQLGIRVRCDECRQGSFITVGNFGQTFRCPRCDYVTSTPAMPNVGYRLAEAAHLFLEQHSDLDALALAALHRRAEIGYSYDFEHDVMWTADSQNEFDFAAVIDGRLVIGESKTGGRLDESSAKVLKRIAKTLQADAVVIAGDRSCEGGCGPSCGGQRDIWETSDTALPSGGGGSPGPREHMVALRADLAPSKVKVIVLCRGDLFGPFVSSSRRTIYL